MILNTFSWYLFVFHVCSLYEQIALEAGRGSAVIDSRVYIAGNKRD